MAATAGRRAEAVPLIVHQTAPDDRNRWDPRWEHCYDTWQDVCPRPKHRHMFWDDAGLRALVEEAFPDLLQVYDGYSEHIQRVDFARAAMLYVHGGLYTDMDVEARKSPFPYLLPGLVSIVESPYPQNERHQNSMMASPPRHPFWLALVKEAARRHMDPSTYTTTWQLTGPQLLDAVADMRPEDVHVLPACDFNPAATSSNFNAPHVFTRHFCTSVWTHRMDTSSMRLYQASRGGNLEAASIAVEMGADLECRDYAGLTPMHHAALKGNAAMISLLVSLRCDVDALDKNDSTPLHYAVQVQSVQSVRALLECRADGERRLRGGAHGGARPVDLAHLMLCGNPNGTPAAAEVLALLRAYQDASPTRVAMAMPVRTEKKPTTNDKPWWAARNKGPAERASSQSEVLDTTAGAGSIARPDPCVAELRCHRGQEFRCKPLWFRQCTPRVRSAVSCARSGNRKH